MSKTLREILTVAMVQPQLVWENPKANKESIKFLLSELKSDIDLIVLPEMFASGFTSNLCMAEEQEGPTFEWMRQLAKAKNAVVVGTVFTKSALSCSRLNFEKKSKNYSDGHSENRAENQTENRIESQSENRAESQFPNRPVNRFYWIRPDGTYSYYDKFHLFKGMEARSFKRGEPHRVIEEWGWKFMPHICYDLRFPEYVRNSIKVNESENNKEKIDYFYDVALFPAAWPTARIRHWEILLQARAIENMIYTIGVNQVGKDGFEKPLGGLSLAVAPNGDLLGQSSEKKAELVCVKLSYAKLQAYRESFTVALDWDLVKQDA